MSKYKKQDGGFNPFGGGGSPEDADNAIFSGGLAGALVDQRVVAKPVNIFDIAPDPRQPRRAVPSVVRGQMGTVWVTNEQLVAQMFDQWAGMAFREGAGHAPRDVHEAHGYYKSLVMVEGEVSTLSDKKPGPVESALLMVVDLAMAIKRDGLVNPITVTRVAGAGTYMIETGERRWLAHHLLHLYDPDGGWGKIAAREVDFNVWRQATENNQRSDLNAISKARQVAILLMDLLTAEGQVFRPYEAFGHEQDYYAQAADLKVPYGKGDQLLNAMGVKGRNSLSEYKALLNLPHEYWEQGDDESWSRDDLLRIVRAANNSTAEDDEPIVHGVNNSTGETPSPQPSPTRGEGVESKPAKPRFGVGASVVTPAGQAGTVVQVISPKLVRVQTVNGIRNYDPDMLLRPEDVAFEVGDAVQVDHTGEIGEVIGVDVQNRAVLVRIDGDEDWHADNDLTSLEMTFAEFVQDEVDRDEVVFDGGDDPAPVNENPFQIGQRVGVNGMKATGTIRYLKGERCGINWDHSGTTHYYDWREMHLLPPSVQGMPVDRRLPSSTPRPGADKAQYQGSGITANDRLLLARGSDVHEMLLAWQRVAVVLGDDETNQLISELRDMTQGEARSLKEAGRLRGVLDAYYAHIEQVMVGQWLAVALAGHFDHIQAVADE